MERSRASESGFKSPSCHLPAVGSWVSGCSPVCQMGSVTAPVSSARCGVNGPQSLRAVMLSVTVTHSVSGTRQGTGWTGQ